jgi:hypothetical protein
MVMPLFVGIIEFEVGYSNQFIVWDSWLALAWSVRVIRSMTGFTAVEAAFFLN